MAPAAFGGLPALVRRDPDAPWLFWRHGLDWRWRSAAAGLAQVASLSRAAATLPDGAVAIPWTPTPEAVELDLALRVAAHDPRPDPGLDPASFLLATAEADEDALARATELASAPPGGVVVEDDGGRRTISAAALADAVAELAGELGPPPRGRDVVVVAGPPLAVGERLALEWALATGAAILVVHPELLPWALPWARPTVVQGSAAGLASLLPEVLAVGPRWRRLRAVLVTDVTTAADAPALGVAGLPVLALAGRLAAPANPTAAAPREPPANG